MSKVGSVQTSARSISQYERISKSVFTSNVSPILDQLSQLYSISPIFEVIQCIFCMMQIIATSCWMDSGNYWVNTQSSENTSASNIFHYITLFSAFENRISELITLFGIITGIVCVVLGLFIFTFLYYLKTKRTLKPILNIIRFYYMMFGNLIIHPAASLLGKLIIYVIDTKEYKYISIAVFTFIILCVIEILIVFNQFFIHGGIYLHRSLFSSFNVLTLLYLFSINPLFLILSTIFHYYPVWTLYILIGVHMIYIVFIFGNNVWMSFVLPQGDVLFSTTLSASLFCDIFRIIGEIYPNKITNDIYLGIIWSAFFVLLVISYFVIKYNKSSIYKKLSYSQNISLYDMTESERQRIKEPTNDEKYAFFDKYGLDRDIHKAISYIIVGIEDNADMVIDFSLIQYCIETYHDSHKMLSFLIHVLAYFKGKKALFDTVLKLFGRLRSKRYFDQFIFYQAYKIKVFRTAASTNLSSFKLNELKLHSKEMEELMKQFWITQSSNVIIIERIENTRRKLDNLWDEAIEENWRSISYREEHIRFIIESDTDFRKAVVMSNMINRIENFKEDRVDLCFLSFIICYPEFLKKSIIDYDGNLITKKDKHSQSNHVTFEKNTGTSSNDMDFTLEESIANSLFTYGKLRLSMQNSLNKASPNTHKYFLGYSIFSVIGSLLVLIISFGILIKNFDNTDLWNKEVGELIELQASYTKAFLSLTFLYGVENNLLNIDEIECRIVWEDTDFPFLNSSTDFRKLTSTYVNSSIERYSNLMSTILELADNNVDVYGLTKNLFRPSVKSTICYNEKVLEPDYWTTNKLICFELLTFSILSGDKNVHQWFTNNSYWCHDITTSNETTSSMTQIRESMSYDLSNSSAAITTNINLAMSTLGPLQFLFFIFPISIICIFYSNELNNLIRMMLATEIEYKTQASNSISKKSQKNQEIMTPINKRTINWKLIIILIFLYILYGVVIVFVELIFNEAREINTFQRNYGFWSGIILLLKPHLMEILAVLANSVYISRIDTNYTTIEKETHRINRILKYFDRSVYDLLNDTPDVDTVLGRDAELDRIITSQACVSKEKTQNLHDIYECASLNRLFASFNSMITKSIEELDFYDGKYSGEFLTNVAHIVFVHIKPTVEKAGERLDEFQNEHLSTYKKTITGLFIGGILTTGVYALLLVYTLFTYKRVFNMLIRLIRRLPPSGITNNHELLNYLLHRKGHDIEMGISQTIFNNSQDGIICMNLDGIIESVNKSFIYDYGYSPEQLLGQMVGTLFDQSSRDILEKQIKFLQNRESTNFEGHLVCFTNENSAVPSYVTLFGLKGNANCLILVVRNETLLIESQEMAENAKQQSQDLLNQILPPKILVMIKEGATDISFVVPYATVMFTNIVAFSAFSATLSPQHIMGTLSIIFGAFDTVIQKYSSIIKIKLIGDSYMAASGLFAQDEKPENHAQQCAEFAINILNIMDDVNFKLNMNLSVRIGINSGGPLIGGVLGTDNRVFDIIGDTINVASRLEHASEPGKIQISETTAAMIKQLGYTTIPRGEIYLKGKGNMKAYFILPDSSSYM
ncbi:hypothetical protein TRFO_35076 [Tritrichomonas foetus]|uniref:Adenylate and Guanylate cyclase catalytic domain containing protein n=1 Tax=Tritrichomonas foetus TaxID=1144522 RepID=A0A1J4JML2_9EUKA|nr:hypothetical protein TRFO_35076 [Tritrichomonas foetus]|eukprot:OHS98484.1 hypothetical protein TRFO_35076 [Tritrichomonas foetus]